MVDPPKILPVKYNVGVVLCDCLGLGLLGLLGEVPGARLVGQAGSLVGLGQWHVGHLDQLGWSVGAVQFNVSALVCRLVCTGAQRMEHKEWCTRNGAQGMVHKESCTRNGAQGMVHKE